jgi:hypothetical protein
LGDRATRALASDICLQLKKILGLLKVHQRGHAILDDAFRHLHEVATQYLAKEEDLELRVSSLALSQGDDALYRVHRVEESITRPLFLDGVKSIGILRGITAAELASVLYLWHAAFEKKGDALRSFTTDCWEADLPHVRIVAIETFSEALEGESEDEKKHKDAVGRLIAERTSTVLDSKDRGTRRSIRISHLDLAVLATPGVDAISAADLADKARPPISAVAEPPEAAARMLADELAHPIERVYVRALFDLAERTEAEDLPDGEMIDELVLKMTRAMLRDRRHLELEQIASSIRSRPRSRALEAIPKAIGTPEVLDPLVQLLDDDAHEGAARAALFLAPKASIGSVLDRLSAPKTHHGRRRLAESAILLEPSESEIARRITDATSEAAEGLLIIARALGEAAFHTIRLAGLESPNVSVRKALVATMTKQEILADRGAAFPLLLDEDAGVRSAVLHAFVGAKDASAVPALEKLLASRWIDETERKAVLSALGMIGGGAAVAALRREVSSEKDPEQLAAAIRGLVRAEGESAKPTIEAVQKRWFLGGQVKNACEEALRRIASGRSTSDVALPPVRVPSVPIPPAEPPTSPARQESGPASPASAARTPTGPLFLPIGGSSPNPPARSPSIPPTRAPSAPPTFSRHDARTAIEAIPLTPSPPPEPEMPAPLEGLPLIVDEGASEGQGVLSDLRLDRGRLETRAVPMIGARLSITVSSSQGPYLTFEAIARDVKEEEGKVDLAIEPLPDAARALLERIARPQVRIPVGWRCVESKADPITDILRAYVDEERR